MCIKTDSMGIIIRSYRNAGCTYPHNKGNGDKLSPEPGDNFPGYPPAERNGDKLTHLMWITYVPLGSVGSVDNLSTLNVFNSTARAIFCGRSSFLL